MQSSTSSSSQMPSGLSAIAQRALAWLREHYYGGRAPVYSVQEIARGVAGRTDGPAPGSTFEPTIWGPLREAIYELQARGLIEQGRLPQGDFGYRIVPNA